MRNSIARAHELWGLQTFVRLAAISVVPTFQPASERNGAVIHIRSTDVQVFAIGMTNLENAMREMRGAA
ncbi:MAG: hypothetical protein AAFP81_17435 [Pseudomonadota bacterium]